MSTCAQAESRTSSNGTCRGIQRVDDSKARLSPAEVALPLNFDSVGVLYTMTELDRIPFLLGLQQGAISDGPAGSSESMDVAATCRMSSIPFTYRFLGLRLRLAFAKRRFQRVEASYREHVSRVRRTITNNNHTNDEPNQNGELLYEELLSSFSALRREIDRIENGHEILRKRAIPKVEELLRLRETFHCFLLGFVPQKVPTDAKFGPCSLPILNLGDETTTALKRKIAEFAGVPTGLLLHDLESLKLLLDHEAKLAPTPDDSGVDVHPTDATE